MAEPKAGEQISIEDFNMIWEAFQKRKVNFPEEPEAMTLGLILFNIGDRYTPVQCVNGEWVSIKSDIPKGEGIPKCPNDHVLTEGKKLVLGWLQEA